MNNPLICHYCNKTLKTNQGLSAHLTKSHKIDYKTHYDAFIKKELDGTCLICKSPTNWNGHAYYKHCSRTCSSIDPTVHNKVINTNLEKYQTNYPIQNKTILDKRDQNNIKKYGKTSYTGTDEYRRKRKITCLNKYGVENPFQLKSNIEKIKYQIFLKTYNRILKFTNIKPLFKAEEYIGNSTTYLYNWQCLKCETIFHHLYDNGIIPVCPKCFPKISNRSNIQNTIKTLLLPHFSNILYDTRNIIKNKELDIYIPDKQVAIEVDGNFWHSEISGNKNKHYHLNKTLDCEQIGIKLLHIFEDELYTKNKIIKSILFSKLNLIKNKIYARNCIIKEIDSKLKNKFLNKYHIQGNDNSTILFGLFYKNTRLVAVMTFSKLRKALGQTHKEGSWELSRFATISNFNIVGGASKLLTHFERNYNPIKIITYADRRWSQGNMYYKLGFKMDHISPPNYWYVNRKNYLTRIHRFNFRKNVLKDKLETFNPELTEWQNMQLNSYDRIWDCGNLVFIKTKIL